MAFEVRSIRESEREECIALWCTVWPGEHCDHYFRRYLYGDVDWLPYYTQVAVLDGKLVSAVQICKRIVACGEYRLTMGGIANVATLPDYRGSGYNTQCLQAAIAVMEADAMDFSLLFTGINAYYARLGFATLPRRWLSGSIRPDFTKRSAEFEVRPVEIGDFEAIYAIYDSYNRTRPITVRRSPAYWRDWIGISDQNKPPLLVAVDDEGAICGYVKSGTFRSAVPYSADAEGIRILELGVDRDSGLPNETAIMQALLDDVAARCVASGQNTLRLDLFAEPTIQRALAGILSEWHEHDYFSAMVRLLHSENLLRGFSMEWNDRWIAAGRPAGALSFATPYGAVHIDGSGSLLRVEAPNEPSETYSQATLFGLLFGILSPEQVTDRPELWPLLAALFPLQAAAYYGSDGF